MLDRTQYCEISSALTASCGFSNRGCFYQGPDDLWNCLRCCKIACNFPDHVDDGNVLLAAELDYRKSNGEFVIAVGFGESPHEACRRASESATDDFGRL